MILVILAVQMSWWCWWSLKDPCQCWQQRALSHFSFSGAFCVCRVCRWWSHSQFLNVFCPSSTPWHLWYLCPRFCLRDSWVLPPVGVVATLLFWQDTVSELGRWFFFIVNMLQCFRWHWLCYTIVRSLVDFQIFQNLEIWTLTTDVSDTQKSILYIYVLEQY